MKKLLSAVLLVIMLASAVAADAETVIRGDEDRGIAIITAGLNEVPEGVSPTTGLTLSEIDVPRGAAGLAATGRYMPMLVQIDNADNGINHRAPWGAIHVDVVSESPLYSSGQTRISMLYSDVIPDAVGPVRSARLGHAWLREEWDCGFMYYGQQEYPATNVTNELKRLGADDKGVLFSGIVGSGRPWKKYYTTRKGLKQPHNKNGNAAAMSALIPAEHTAPNHAYLFTDEPLAEGDDAVTVGIHWLNKLYNSELRYDAATGTYTRYMHDESDKEWTYVDYDTKEPITFSNIIV